MHFQRRLSFCDAWADLQHMCAQDPSALGIEVIGVIFHEGGAPFEPRGHHFHCPNQRASLPVPLRAKSESITHQALRCDSRQLSQTMQILECVCKSFKISLREK